MKEAVHPTDFSPLLDGDFSDERGQAIRAHVETCRACRSELESWRRVDGLFRSSDFEIEVPPWQWTRIEARLKESGARTGWLASLRRTAPWYGWAAAASVVMLASLTVGVRQHRQSAERETLLAVARFAETEEPRLKSAANPFRNGQISSDNPFTRFQSDTIQKQNPFARR